VYTKEKRVFYPAKQKTKGLLEMPAAINVHDGTIHYWFFDWKNAFIIIQCFEELLQNYPNKDIFVIVDNWRAHTCYAVRVWAFFHPRFHLVFLPTNSSWMNMIERVFSKFDKDILQNSNFSSVQEAMNRIDCYFKNESTFQSWSN